MKTAKVHITESDIEGIRTAITALNMVIDNAKKSTKTLQEETAFNTLSSIWTRWEIEIADQKKRLFKSKKTKK